ncbi:MAG: peptidoglycan DD-metalloendopeptidase family protein [Bacillota bacterium]|nr:peptidoglycan DD-metalloendopeptidase family protein [Bacillota bacterium]
MTNIISLLLCLFLCTTQAFSIIEKQDYITLCQEVSFEQAISLSSRIQEEINHCMRIEELEQKMDEMCRMEKEELENEIQSLKEKKNLCLEEKEEFIKKSEWNQKELECISRLKEIEKELALKNKQFKEIKRTMATLQKRLIPISERRKNDEKAQAILEERFAHQIAELQEGGEYNVHKVIKGSENLPVYGSQKTYRHSSLYSCLVAGDYEIDNFSEYWIYPIQGGRISAGTWCYPSGDMHLGMDYAVSLYTPVVAPANGLILYADNPVSSNNGYLGNMCGWPYGGGNTIAMICAVGGSIYGMSFAHLSNTIYVYPGQQVSQGQVIALSGNSGNSTGPHCHIELFSLTDSLETVVNYFASTADFSFGCGWSAPATCSGYGCRIRPERIL